MNILLLELNYLDSSNKRAHSAAHCVQLARLMKKYTRNKVFLLTDPESDLLPYAKKYHIDCLLEPKGFFSALKLALLLKRYKIDIVHTFDLLSAQVATKALSFASSVKHIHSENRNTEKDDMLLTPAFKKLDACIFAHKSYEGQYKYKYIYQEEHRPVDFFLADIFPLVDIEKEGQDDVISLEDSEIITKDTSFLDDKKDEKRDEKKDEAVKEILNKEDLADKITKESKAENKFIEKIVDKDLEKDAIKINLDKDESSTKNTEDKTTKNISPNFLPYNVSKKKIRFILPYSAALTDLDLVTNALRCFHEYEGHIHKWEAYFIGSEVDVEKILKYAKKYDIQEHIVIFRKDIEKEDFEKSEISIISTYKDEYNLEDLCKAWTSYKPVIITQRMPYFEKIANGKNLLLPDLETALSLSSMMHKMVQDAECRSTIIENLQSMDLEIEAEKSAQMYAQIYDEVYAKPKVK